MKKGFTMVEMLVAITIMAIGLLSLALIFPAGLRAAMTTRMNTQAIEYCQQKVEALRIAGFNSTDLAAGTHTADSLPMDDVDNVFIREYTVTDDYPVTDMKKIEVSIEWDLRGKTYNREIITYIGK